MQQARPRLCGYTSIILIRTIMKIFEQAQKQDRWQNF